MGIGGQKAGGPPSPDASSAPARQHPQRSRRPPRNTPALISVFSVVLLLWPRSPTTPNAVDVRHRGDQVRRATRLLRQRSRRTGTAGPNSHRRTPARGARLRRSQIRSRPAASQPHSPRRDLTTPASWHPAAGRTSAAARRRPAPRPRRPARHAADPARPERDAPRRLAQPTPRTAQPARPNAAAPRSRGQHLPGAARHPPECFSAFLMRCRAAPRRALANRSTAAWSAPIR